MSDCIFCKIASKEIPSAIVYEDEQMLAFKDIEPQAPVHVLLIPKKHIDSANTVAEEDIDLIGKMFLKIKDIAEDLGLDNGYRIVNNCGEDGLQTVQHLHFHLLGGRKMQWPPG
ncbi:MAG: histidine triad nucleotide-binding protein [Clostridia bacterium]|nr:histidine triad nucleotide-binding protein [Clostridia bacterium]